MKYTSGLLKKVVDIFSWSNIFTVIRELLIACMRAPCPRSFRHPTKPLFTHNSSYVVIEKKKCFLWEEIQEGFHITLKNVYDYYEWNSMIAAR